MYFILSRGFIKFIFTVFLDSCHISHSVCFLFAGQRKSISGNWCSSDFPTITVYSSKFLSSLLSWGFEIWPQETDCSSHSRNAMLSYSISLKSVLTFCSYIPKSISWSKGSRKAFLKPAIFWYVLKRSWLLLCNCVLMQDSIGRRPWRKYRYSWSFGSTILCPSWVEPLR